MYIPVSDQSIFYIFEIFRQARLFTRQQQQRKHAVPRKKQAHTISYTLTKGRCVNKGEEDSNTKKRNGDERGQSGRSGKLRQQAEAKLLSRKPLAYLSLYWRRRPEVLSCLLSFRNKRPHKMWDRNGKRASYFAGTQLFGTAH